MPAMKNFVAVDWRKGDDRLYFFFKDKGTYSKFPLGMNYVGPNYPASVEGSWGDFDQHAKDLKFGFHTDAIEWGEGGTDFMWLFYYQGTTPMVCKYSETNDNVVYKRPLSQTLWRLLGPYFDRIVGVMWLKRYYKTTQFRVLMNDGNYLDLDIRKNTVEQKSLIGSHWQKLHYYKDRLITAVQNDYPMFDNYYYIFITNNQYFRFDMDSKWLDGPNEVDDVSWPGLLND
ncbi:hypothetical protein GIW70_01185 [Pseudomonas syringae]|nr:hypothetical protein [Pseudomonas syringae]MCF5066811.1 hypothetical protein [Pseudomonas syringae]